MERGGMEVVGGGGKVGGYSVTSEMHIFNFQILSIKFCETLAENFLDIKGIKSQCESSRQQPRVPRQ